MYLKGSCVFVEYSFNYWLGCMGAIKKAALSTSNKFVEWSSCYYLAFVIIWVVCPIKFCHIWVLSKFIVLSQSSIGTILILSEFDLCDNLSLSQSEIFHTLSFFFTIWIFSHFQFLINNLILVKILSFVIIWSLKQF